MGLFDKLKPNKNNKDFFEWLDLILKNELNKEWTTRRGRLLTLFA